MQENSHKVSISKYEKMLYVIVALVELNRQVWYASGYSSVLQKEVIVTLQ